MTPFAVIFVLFSSTCAEAVSIPSGHDDISTGNPNANRKGWSRQDTITLAGVCVAVLGILIGVLVASPQLREWLCIPFRRKLNPYLEQQTSLNLTLSSSIDCTIQIRRRRMRQEDEARRRLRERYEDYARFNEFLEIVG